MDCMKGDYEKALDHINRSLSTNDRNLRALNLKTIILRRTGRVEEADKMARTVLELNPMDLISALELEWLEKGSGMFAESSTVLGELQSDRVESMLEAAAHYMNYGGWEEAMGILSNTDSDYPMIHYYRGYLQHMLDNENESLKHYRLAASMPGDYCFPYRKESLRVLEEAAEKHPEDAAVRYYLGNMLFDSQPEKALDLWEESGALDDSNPIVHRNLGMAYEKVLQDYVRAVKSYEKAVELDPDPRFIYELDVLYEKTGEDIKTRKELFRANRDAVSGRVDALVRMVLVQIQSDDFDGAIQTLEDHYFYRWEGGNAVRTYYEDAHLLRGTRRFQDGQYELALEDFQAALEYPDNLEEGRPEHDPRFVQTYYCIGMALEELGKRKEAREYFRLSAGEDPERSEYLFYRSRAWGKLGDRARAEEDAGKLRELSLRSPGSDFFAKFGERRSPNMIEADRKYYEGLASLASGNAEDAKKAFRAALDANPNHSWVKMHLRGLR
jgi:tetratricopeptide (TPR) repeat protein